MISMITVVEFRVKQARGSWYTLIDTGYANYFFIGIDLDLFEKELLYELSVSIYLLPVACLALHFTTVIMLIRMEHMG